MIRTNSVSDPEEIRRYVEAHPELRQKGEALADIWLSLAYNEAEFRRLEELIPETHWLLAAQLLDGSYVVLHRKVAALPATTVPDFPCENNSQRWLRSRAFWVHTDRCGWRTAGIMEHLPTEPVRKMLRARFGKSHPWYLSREEFSVAWEIIARGPVPKEKVN